MKYFLAAVMLAIFPRFSFAEDPRYLNAQERKYLMDLAEDTYRYINFARDPKTGLPYDNSRQAQQHYTSITNVGLYLADLVGAVELGFETRASALEKARQVIQAMQGARAWLGFPYCWMNTDPSIRHSDPFISSVDLGNYYAGVIVARQYFPEIADDCDTILQAADWNKLYHPAKKLLYGGYNAEKNKYTDWVYVHLGSEARLASILAIAMSGISVDHWKALDRTLEKRYGIEYLKPGWQGGGLFLGYLAGIFVNEAGTVCGISAGNFAKAQMLHKEKLRYRVWGWSASESPQHGYLGINALRDHVVTPHASALAVSHFPKEVVENLKKLEELGLRPLHMAEGQRYEFGFRDSYDMKTERITPVYLMLDQSMIFLSLANFFSDRIINRMFESYPPVHKTLADIPDFAEKITAETAGFPIELAKITGTKVVSEDLARPIYKINYSSRSPLYNPEEWSLAQVIPYSNELIEAGKIVDQRDFYATVSALWDREFLYINANVHDQSIQIKHKGAEIYKSDLVEIYVNPDGQGLTWGNTRDFQIGITPPATDGVYHTYSWFQRRRPADSEMKILSVRTEDGYKISAAISWKYLRLRDPVRGQTFGISVGMNDLDDDSIENTKLNWFFKTEEGKITLGKMILQ